MLKNIYIEILMKKNDILELKKERGGLGPANNNS